MAGETSVGYAVLGLLIVAAAGCVAFLWRDFRKRIVRRQVAPTAVVPEMGLPHETLKDILDEIVVLKGAIHNMRADLQAGREPGPAPLALPPHLRRKLLRFEECGSTPGQIAEILRVPKPEVEFLLKIQKLSPARTPACIGGRPSPEC